MNLEGDVNNKMKRSKGLLGKRFLEFNYCANKSSKFAKFTKNFKLNISFVKGLHKQVHFF